MHALPIFIHYHMRTFAKASDNLLSIHLQGIISFIHFWHQSSRSNLYIHTYINIPCLSILSTQTYLFNTSHTRYIQAISDGLGPYALWRMCVSPRIAAAHSVFKLIRFIRIATKLIYKYVRIYIHMKVISLALKNISMRKALHRTRNCVWRFIIGFSVASWA